jgi:hypothetical protein
MKIKCFKDVKTLDELRKTYRQLAIANHPDKGGNTADMQEINTEYDYLSKNLINGHKNVKSVVLCFLKAQMHTTGHLPGKSSI